MRRGPRQKAAYAHARKLHLERNGDSEPPDIQADPELAAAWRSLQLHWLQVVPGYREEIKERVSEAAKRAEAHSKRIDTYHRDRLYDRDFLGREVEGCG